MINKESKQTQDSVIHKKKYRLHFETNGHCRVFEKSSGKLVYSGDIVEVNQWLEENDK